MPTVGRKSESGHFGRHKLLQPAASALALLLTCVPFTVGAILAFPIWDDGWLWLLIKEHGVDAIAPAFRDRPVNAGLWSLLAPSERVFWSAAFVAQAFAWPLLGFISALLWSRLFPSLRRYAFVVACVAVAPFITKVQMVTANIALASLFSVVLAYSALLLLLRFVALGHLSGVVALIASLPVLSSAILIQEYALGVVVVTLVLLSWYFWLAPDSRTRTLGVFALVIVTTSASYASYLLMTDPGARPDAQPFNVLALGAYDLIRLSFALLSLMWRSVVGGLASSLGELTWMSKANLFAAAYGALVAGLLFYGSRNGTPASLFQDEGGKREVFVLLLALAAGLMPMLLMGRTPWDPSDGMSSRFGLPVIPIVAALTVRMAIGLVRRNLWAVPVVVIGFTTGTTAVAESWSAVSERRAMAALGTALRHHVASGDGYTVAVVPLGERALGRRRQWELTARLSATWPAELSRKFWSYRIEDAEEVFGKREDCETPQKIDMEIRIGPDLHRGLTRKGQLERLLWVGRQPDGSISVEPYCVRELLAQSWERVGAEKSGEVLGAEPGALTAMKLAQEN